MSGIFILEEHVSNLGRIIDYSEYFHGFIQSVETDANKFLPTHNS